MPDGERAGSRVAELAVELLGARMAHEFLTEAWASAAPDARAAISADLVDEVRKWVKDQSRWDVRSMIECEIAREMLPMVRAYVQDHLEEIRAKIAAALPEALQAEVERVKRTVRVGVSVTT